MNNSKQLILKTCTKGINANNANTEDLITHVKKTLNKYITDDTVMAKINVIEVAKLLYPNCSEKELKENKKLVEIIYAAVYEIFYERKKK